jgi:hypothetical protein
MIALPVRDTMTLPDADISECPVAADLATV